MKPKQAMTLMIDSTNSTYFKSVNSLHPVAACNKTRRTHLTVALDTKELNEDQSSKKWRDPGGIVDTIGSRPVVNNIAGSRNLEWQNCKPTNGVLPSTGEAPRGIDEATNVHGECSVDWVHDRKFGQCLHHQVHHYTNEGEANDDRGRSTGDERGSRSNEQTRADGTATGTMLVYSVKQCHFGVSSKLTWQSFAYGGPLDHA